MTYRKKYLTYLHRIVKQKDREEAVFTITIHNFQHKQKEGLWGGIPTEDPGALLAC